MLTGFTVTLANKRKVDAWVGAALGAMAAVVYALTVSRGIYPGESARLMATFSGVEPLDLPLHPVWGAIVTWLSSVPVFSLPFRLNLFSACCTVVSVVLLYRLMAYLVQEVIVEEYSVDYAPKVSILAGVVTAFAFMFALPVWFAATRLQYQSFDLMWLLAQASLLLVYAQKRWRWLLAVFALSYGLGIVESVIFMTMAPIFLIFLIQIQWRNGELSLSRMAWLGLLAVAGMSLYYFSARHFYHSTNCADLGLRSVTDVVVRVWKNQFVQLRAGVPHFKGLFLLIMGVMPWLAALFASFQALNNERSWSQYILNFTLSLLAVFGLTNVAISPWEIMRPLGQLPVLSYAMIAMVTGYAVAYWYLLIVVKRPKRGFEMSEGTKVAGEWLGLILAYPMAGIVVIAAIVNVFRFGRSDGAFADRCAREILGRMDGRVWLVTDGTLDPHLQLLARQSGQELNLLCLQKDMSRRYLKSLAQLIEQKRLFEGEALQRMKSTLDLGVLPFLQDWFASDAAIEKKVAVFGVPDFWYTAHQIPAPEFLFFVGCRDINVYRDRSPLAEYKAFWAEMEPMLRVGTKPGDALDPTQALRANMRRHMGFVANNLGVLLEDVGNDHDAYAVYTYVHNILDPSNISAMFNRFEMARRGARVASADKELIERELREFVSKLSHQYSLWSLSRYFGYVRSPEIFARLGWGWAMSGQYGAALAGMRRAIDLLPTEERITAMQAVAQIYALADDRSKTEAVYQDIIKSDPNNRVAMLGLARIAVKEGAIDKARQWLERAASSDDKRGALGVEWATIHLMNNDVPRARMTLQETTDLQPQNLQAWAMLAMLQIRQNEIEQVEKVVLPKMESVAGTADNYFIQITRAQVFLQKGDSVNYKRIARESFIRASILRPDMPAVKDMILQLDIAMNDQESAELHARQVLRTSRKHALANYVMGSLRLQERQYGDAEDFLRRSVETKPSAAALNDLAEVMRRIKKFEEAEKFAREAIALSPDLYVAWETLASVLAEADKDIAEAERAVRKAMELNAEDVRVLITLARILLKKGDVEKARDSLYKVRSRQSELSRFEQGELARLTEEATSKRQR